MSPQHEHPPSSEASKRLAETPARHGQETGSGKGGVVKRVVKEMIRNTAIVSGKRLKSKG